MAGYGFYEACGVIESASPYTVGGVADAWRNFAEACRGAAAQTRATSDDVTAQYGAPYQAFGERAGPVAAWLSTVAQQASSVGNELSKIHSTGSKAQMEMYQQRYEVDRAWDRASADTTGTYDKPAMMRTRNGAVVLNGAIDDWSSVYAALQPGQIPPAPTRAGGGGTGGAGGSGGIGSTAASSNDGGTGVAQAGLLSGGTGSGSGGTGGSPGAGGSGGAAGSGGGTGGGGADQAPPPGGAGDQSNSSVVGQDGGDFAGWVRDPRTGFLVNPTTGQEFDPVTGRWVDPVTGRPFGDVVQYATRLEGLTPGTGSGAGGVAPLLAGGSGGGQGGVASLFGGMLPPSLLAGNPAASQLQQSAASTMAAKAFAAQQFAMKEAMQGGRYPPYLPPMSGGTGAGGSGGRRRVTRGRLLTEPGSTWGGRTRQGGTTSASGTGSSGTAAVARSGGGGGARGATNPYLPPMSGAGATEKDRRRARHGSGGEDDVWSVDHAAAPPVLGEE